MDRRTMLKRLGAAGIGAATIGAGSAAALGDDAELHRVEIDGETKYVSEDVDVEEVYPDCYVYCGECPPNSCCICPA